MASMSMVHSTTSRTASTPRVSTHCNLCIRFRLDSNSNSDWEILFSNLDVQPFLITQDDRVVSIAESGYPWPPMHLSGGQELSPSSLENYLNNFYTFLKFLDIPFELKSEGSIPFSSR